MPLLDSFKVDHTKMKGPAVRLAKEMATKSGEPITIYDLRFYTPNEAMMGEKGTHTLEHLFAGFMREHVSAEDVEVIDISPMGCRTGFYMSVIGRPSEERVIKAWDAAMKDILKVENESQIPELNVYQCGSAKMHSLEEAKKIANDVLKAGIGVMKNEELTLDEKFLAEKS